MKPILFSTPMVQAILEGRKTQTRRVVTPQPVIDRDGFWHWKDCQWADGGLGMPQSGIDDYAPYKPGDILWVRETFMSIPRSKNDPCPPMTLEKDGFVTIETRNGVFDFCYRADDTDKNPDDKWQPSIFMPREAARIFLEVKSVRVERVQDITGEDAKAEGCINSNGSSAPYINIFRELWFMKTHPRYGWDVNPWVWVYEFERSKNADTTGK